LGERYRGFRWLRPEKCLEKVEAAYKNTHLELDMAKAVADADLVIESMAENVEDKSASTRSSRR